MKLLVGRFVLGCISAVLVLADVATEKSIVSSTSVTTPEITLVDIVTEKLPTDLTPEIDLPQTESSPDKNTKILSNPNTKKNIEREIVVIRDELDGDKLGHHDHGHHDHHDHHGFHEIDHHHDIDFHHPPPHHHHEHHHSPPPPPHHHHYPQPYPGYYPPHYPPYSHGMPPPYAGGAIPPPYPYYPPSSYYNQPSRKPSATIIQTTTLTSGQNNRPKPTDLLNQGTEYLWNLFGKLGAVTDDNHEVVLINPKMAPSTGSVQMLPPSWYSKKVKIIPNIDCNNKKE